jgi:hypothetical protein
MKTQFLRGDTLRVSKSALTLATEIKVLEPRGAMTYR